VAQYSIAPRVQQAYTTWPTHLVLDEHVALVGQRRAPQLPQRRRRQRDQVVLQQRKLDARTFGEGSDVSVHAAIPRAWRLSSVDTEGSKRTSRTQRHSHRTAAARAGACHG
jgi:hypothetical protein